MSDCVMLVLIGGRSAIPVTAGALQFLNEVDRVKFLLCDGKDYPSFQENVEKVLKQERVDLLFDKTTDVKIVNPNKFDDVYTTLAELCKDVEELKLKYVNLTTAPQTMAFSVYSYVLEKYPDALVFSVNTDQSEITPLVFGKQPIDFNKKLSVKNYIALCGLNIHKQKSGYEESFESLTQYFVECLETSTKILYQIRRNAGGDSITAPRTFTIKEQDLTKLAISEMQVETFFNKLREAEIIQRFEKSNPTISFRVETQDNYAFLAGDWLEFYVYISAKQCGFDSVEMGIELDNYRGEVDVFALNNTNAIICECKTGKFDSNDLSRLSSKAEKLGGNYCVKLFITSETQVSNEHQNQAINYKVRLVSGNDLSNLTEILKKEMKAPTYPRR
jgi:Holliday junction resolvase